MILVWIEGGRIVKVVCLRHTVYVVLQHPTQGCCSPMVAITLVWGY